VKKRGFTIVLIIICAIVFAVSAFQLIRYYSANSKSEDAYAQLRPPAEKESDDGVSYEPMSYEDLLPYYQSLKEENGDFVGWLRIPDSEIDYPVMQTKDSPEYYIDKNFKKQYQTAGSLFASEISDVDKPTDMVIIYGHHMKTGAMFGTMGDWLEKDFFNAHQEVIFDTLTERNEYVVYGLFKTQVYTDDPAEFAYYAVSDFEDQAAFDAFMQQVESRMQIMDPTMRPMYGEKMIMLSTCEYSQENGRLVMLAVRK
jgi:sortase B